MTALRGAVEGVAAEASASRRAGTFTDVRTGECAATTGTTRLATASTASTVTVPVFLTVAAEVSLSVIDTVNHYDISRLNAAIVANLAASVTWSAALLTAEVAPLCEESPYRLSYSDATMLNMINAPVGFPCLLECEAGYQLSSGDKAVCNGNSWTVSGSCAPLGVTTLAGTPVTLHFIRIEPINESLPFWTTIDPPLYQVASNHTECFRTVLGHRLASVPDKVDVGEFGYGFGIVVTMPSADSSQPSAETQHALLQDPSLFAAVVTCMNGALDPYESYLQLRIPIPSYVENYWQHANNGSDAGTYMYRWETCSCFSYSQRGHKCAMDVDGALHCEEVIRECLRDTSDHTCRMCIIVYCFIIIAFLFCSCCCCWCYCRYFQVGPFKRVFKGHAIIQERNIKMKVPYHLEDVRVEHQGHHEAHNGMHNEGAPANKTRVVWDLDENETRLWFQKINDDGDENGLSWHLDGDGLDEWDNEEPPSHKDHVAVHIAGEEGAEVTADVDMMSKPSFAKLRGQMSWALAKAGGLGNTAGEGNSNSNLRSAACGNNKSAKSAVSIAGKNQAYKIYEVVEYFSSTMGMWIPARIFALESFEDGPDAVRVSYTVKVDNSGQIRRGVALDEPRNPLNDGDRVEVFVEKLGPRPATWMPGSISRSTKGAAWYGYKLTLDNTELLTEVSSHTVQAVQVRRRFEVGTPIEVYFGARKGWLPGIVLSLEEPSLEETAAAELQRIDPTMAWERTRKQAIEDVRKKAKACMRDSAAARHWMQKGSVAVLGVEWEAWRLLRVQVYEQKGAHEPSESDEEPTAPTAEQPAPIAGQEPPESAEEPPAPTAEPPALIEEPAPTGEQPAPTAEQPATTREQPGSTWEHPTPAWKRPVPTEEQPTERYDNIQAATPENTFVVPTFLLRMREVLEVITV